MSHCNGIARSQTPALSECTSRVWSKFEPVLRPPNSTDRSEAHRNGAQHWGVSRQLKSKTTQGSLLPLLYQTSARSEPICAFPKAIHGIWLHPFCVYNPLYVHQSPTQGAIQVPGAVLTHAFVPVGEPGGNFHKPPLVHAHANQGFVHPSNELAFPHKHVERGSPVIAKEGEASRKVSGSFIDLWLLLLRA